jgi:hypothetical protein
MSKMSLESADELKPFICDNISGHEQSVDLATRKTHSKFSIRLLLYLNTGLVVLTAILLIISASLKGHAPVNSTECFDG